MEPWPTTDSLWTLHWSRQEMGANTGPNPCDRGRPGSKIHLTTDGQGVPLAAALSAANVHEGSTLPTMLQAAESVIGKTQAKRSALADKVDDSHSNHLYCRLHGLRDAIAERGKQESALGGRRWVIERTFAWLKRNRRLVIRYERRADIHLGLILLGCALIASHFCR